MSFPRVLHTNVITKPGEHARFKCIPDGLTIAPIDSY